MALRSLSTIVDDPPGLKRILTQITTLSVKTAAGAGAATPIAIAGLLTTATIIAAFRIDNGANTVISLVDITSLASIPSAGNVQFSAATNQSAGNQVLVFFFNNT